MIKFLHRLFEEQVKLHPSKNALKFKEQVLTYEELDQKSTQFSNYLIAEGVKEGDIIKICIERSLEMFIGILGILKSGAAYLPIDSEITEQRLQFLCEDSTHPFFISKLAISEKFSETLSAFKVFNLDSDWETISKASRLKKKSSYKDSSPAVVLYTSGSTGTPKGVVLSHSSLTNHISWNIEKYKISPKNILLQHASYTFDFSLLEIFMALGNGCLLVLSRPKFHYESFYLIELIQKEKISILCSVPSLLKTYVKYEEFSKCSSLKTVFLGGEVLDAKLVGDFFEKSMAQLINTYGPTECSIAVLHWVCKRRSKVKSIPIGFPVAGMKIHLLDKNKQQVKPGKIGEIYISGPGVAKEYYNRPELTSVHFSTENANETLYKTGDLGSVSKEGSYQFHGRIDFQIKVRGQRIELKEIEHNLFAYKHIENCIVIGHKITGEDTKIIAYYISSELLCVQDLRCELLTKLPEYMIPNLFVSMDAFPLSPNGKIDRGALPIPDKSRLCSEISYVAPENELQKILVEIWEKVLDIRPIGITDVYYLLGGDSLRNVIIFGLIEEKTQIKFNVLDFLEADTIQKQAELIEKNEKVVQSSQVKYLRKEGGGTPILIVQLLQGEGYNLPKEIIHHLDDKHPVLTTVPFGSDPKKIPNSIEQAAMIYVAALERICTSNTFALLGYSMTGLVANAITEILEKKGKKVEFLFLLDTYHPSTIQNKFNDYSTLNRLAFYGKKFIKSDRKAKKEIRSFVFQEGNNKIKNFIIKYKKNSSVSKLVKKNTSFTRAEKHASNPRKMNFSLAIKYVPKQVSCKVVLMIATGDPDSIHYKDFLSIISENTINLKRDITNDMLTYKLPMTHASMLYKENMETIAQLFNEYSLENN